MPRPRLDQDAQDALLDAAVRVIARRGTDRTRLADVAREVGRSTGTLQHYFGSRDELLAAAFHRLNEQGGAEARRVADAVDDPWARVVALIGVVLGSGPDWRQEWQVWLEFWAACARDAQLRRRTADLYDNWRALLGAAIDDGAARGDFSPAAPTAEIVTALLAAIDGTALHGLLGIGGLDRAGAAAVVERLARSYLGVPGDVA
jgi:AcrR family transcriptional regulator